MDGVEEMGNVTDLQKYKIEKQYKEYYKNRVNLAFDIVYDKKEVLKGIAKSKMTLVASNG